MKFSCLAALTCVGGGNLDQIPPVIHLVDGQTSPEILWKQNWLRQDIDARLAGSLRLQVCQGKLYNLLLG
jgi:hypothetical protein